MNLVELWKTMEGDNISLWLVLAFRIHLDIHLITLEEDLSWPFKELNVTADTALASIRKHFKFYREFDEDFNKKMEHVKKRL